MKNLHPIVFLAAAKEAEENSGRSVTIHTRIGDALSSHPSGYQAHLFYSYLHYLQRWYPYFTCEFWWTGDSKLVSLCFYFVAYALEDELNSQG